MNCNYEYTPFHRASPLRRHQSPARPISFFGYALQGAGVEELLQVFDAVLAEHEGVAAEIYNETNYKTGLSEVCGPIVGRGVCEYHWQRKAEQRALNLFRAAQQCNLLCSTAIRSDPRSERGRSKTSAWASPSSRACFSSSGTALSRIHNSSPQNKI